MTAGRDIGTLNAVFDEKIMTPAMRQIADCVICPIREICRPRALYEDQALEYIVISLVVYFRLLSPITGISFRLQEYSPLRINTYC
ncbi:hypothetical protein BaRGS_00012599 [Batillaria attramentaria]|uniref:Uncharacterized protein n=1 Tax=Batillaria attramentaria TaxID=370345 RepID=A0ABD0L9V8_9CAEN